MSPFATSTITFRLAGLLALLLTLASPAQASDNHPPVKRPHAAPAPASPRQAAPTASLVAPVLPAAPTAPQLVQLKGIVLNPDGRPCAGASVYPAGAPRQLVVTDALGAFALPVPAGGAVSLRVEYFGEGSSRVEVPTPGAEPLRITLGK